MIAEADACEKLAAQLHREGDYVRAQENYERALAILEERAVFNTERAAIIRLHHSLGLLHRLQNAFDLAEPHYQRAWELARAQFGEAHEESATRRNYLAGLYCAARRYEESKALLEDSLRFYQAALGVDHEVTVLTHYALALVSCRSTNQAGEVAPVIGGDCKAHYERAGSVLNIDIASLDVMKDSDLHRALMRLSYDRFVEGRFEEAEELFRHALLSELNEIWPRHPLVADSYQLLADLYRSFGTPEQSEHLYRLALEIRTECFGPLDPKAAASAYSLGMLLLDLQRVQDAEPLLLTACSAYRSNDATFPPLLGNSLAALAKALRLQQREEEAAEAEREAKEIFAKFGVNVVS